MLKEITDKSYEIFGRYNPARPLDICTECCMTPEDESRLASMRVQDIPAQLLSEYNDGAKPLKTSVEEIKHFLPRYLELIGLYQFPTHSAELSFSRVIPFDENEWTETETGILREYSRAFFRRCLSIYPIPSASDSITTILIMFQGAGSGLRELFPVYELLEIWEAEATNESLLHFRDLYFHGFDPHHPAKLSSPFGDSELASVLRRWIESENTRQLFSAAIEKLILEDNSLSDIDAGELSLLYEILGNG
ncbi:MAG: hypothetical protein ACK5Q2_06875 [Bacteroidota bacterium]